MKLIHGRSPVRAGVKPRAVTVVALVLLLVAVSACGSKSAADSASDELNAGLAADAAGNPTEAAVHYKACLTFEPTNKYCLFDLGVIAQNANQPVEAENNYRLALAQDPDFTPALYNLAILRSQAGSLDEAIALYRHMLQIDSTNASGHFNLGMALVASGDVEGGKKELAEGVRLNPGLVIASPLPVPSGSTAPTRSPAPSASNEPSPSRTAGPSASAVNAGLTITSLSPASRHRGISNLAVSVTGTGFVRGVFLAFSGTGVSVHSVTRTSSTHLTVNVSVSAGAAIGTRDVTVTNPNADSYTLPNGFTVLN